MESTVHPSLYTREKHRLCVDTVKKLSAAKNGKTWRELAESLGYSKTYAATLHKVARGVPGSLTRQSERVLRERLGIKPRNRKKYHRPCLDDAEYARFLEWRRNA